MLYRLYLRVVYAGIFVCIIIIGATCLSGCAALNWYEAHTPPLSCAYGGCDAAELAAQAKLTTSVDMGPHYDSARVSVDGVQVKPAKSKRHNRRGRA